MKRAWLERHRTKGKWRGRHPLDDALELGYYRKGRRARGCPRFCSHCASVKVRPSVQVRRARLSFGEQIDLFCVQNPDPATASFDT